MRALQMAVLNEEGSFNSNLDGDSEHYQERLTTISLPGESNVLTNDQNECKRKKIPRSKNCRSTIYPVKLMRPNFIVDLMDTPGDLIPVGSARAKVYCVKKYSVKK